MDPARPSSVTARLRASGSVFAEEEAAVLLASARSSRHLEELVAARESGRPLEHVVGWVDFAGGRMRVDAGVFVPRRRSELLVEVAAEGLEQGDVVVELCCGVAAVSAALLARQRLEVYAVDVDPGATAVARRNLPSTASVLTGDLDAPLPDSLRGRVALLVANAPYVPSEGIATMPPEAREHEPRVALDGGADGLDVHRRIAGRARRWLAPRGRLLLEASARQAGTCAEILAGAGLGASVHEDPGRDAVAVAGTNLWPTSPGLA